MPAERTVYVLDDDVAVRRSLQRLLDAAGLNVICYDTPFSFLDAAPQLASGCLLLDIKMPGMDGLEVQALLRQRKVSIPVIMMTGQGDVQGAVRAMKAGAVDFIEKPYNDDVLLNAIEAALRRFIARTGPMNSPRRPSGSPRSPPASARFSMRW